MSYRRKAPARRSAGYHYGTRRDGTKYRIYDNPPTKRRTYTSARKPYRAAPSKPPPKKSSALGRFGRTLATTGGSVLGGLYGGPIGATLGGAAGKLFSSIVGMGDYASVSNPMTVSTNSLMMPQSAAQVPNMHSDGSGSTRIQHREFLADFSTSQPFTASRFPINPANSRLFPWLSSIAPSFEQYAILGMMFEYKTTSGDNSNAVNPGLGSVSIATQYNVLSPVFTDKQQMLNHQFSTSCKPSESMIHAIECERSQTPNQPLYVRNARQDPAIAFDARLYDHGRIEVSSVGGTAVTPYTSGELWITYDILLFKPRLSTGAVQLVIDPPEPLSPPVPGPEIHQPEIDLDDDCDECANTNIQLLYEEMKYAYEKLGLDPPVAPVDCCPDEEKKQ